MSLRLNRKTPNPHAYDRHRKPFVWKHQTMPHVRETTMVSNELYVLEEAYGNDLAMQLSHAKSSLSFYRGRARLYQGRCRTERNSHLHWTRYWMIQALGRSNRDNVSLYPNQTEIAVKLQQELKVKGGLLGFQRDTNTIEEYQAMTRVFTQVVAILEKKIKEQVNV